MDQMISDTLTVYINSVEIQKFSVELDEEHAIALQQQEARAV